ncbi:MAG: FAD-binding protein [Cyanobacteriota bacterium]
MYDIVIIGLGPAGATLARHISKNYSVLALDKRDLLSPHKNGGFEKSCGGLLAPDAQEMLAKFGLGLPKDVLVDPQLFTVRTIDIPNALEAYYQRHYINLDREKFDRWLVSLIPQNVELCCESLLKSFEPESERVKIIYKKNSKEYTAYTKILVAADGANSIIRRALCPESFKIKTYISIQEYFKVDKNTPFFSAIFDEEICDFYSWTIPKEDYFILGSALRPRDNVNNKFELLKTKLKKYNFNFDNKIKRNGAYILRPEKTKQIFLGTDRVAFIGEAAGLISPSSAEGLSYGFKSAYILSKALEPSLNNYNNRYQSSIKHLISNLFIKNFKAQIIYNPKIRKTIIRLGINSMKMYS